jgi:hypothetical protein
MIVRSRVVVCASQHRPPLGAAAKDVWARTSLRAFAQLGFRTADAGGVVLDRRRVAPFVDGVCQPGFHSGRGQLDGSERRQPLTPVDLVVAVGSGLQIWPPVSQPGVEELAESLCGGRLSADRSGDYDSLTLTPCRS